MIYLASKNNNKSEANFRQTWSRFIAKKTAINLLQFCFRRRRFALPFLHEFFAFLPKNILFLLQICFRVVTHFLRLHPKSCFSAFLLHKEYSRIWVVIHGRKRPCILDRLRRSRNPNPAPFGGVTPGPPPAGAGCVCPWSRRSRATRAKEENPWLFARIFSGRKAKNSSEESGRLRPLPSLIRIRHRLEDRALLESNPSARTIRGISLF